MQDIQITKKQTSADLLRIVDAAIDEELDAAANSLVTHGFTLQMIGEFTETLYMQGNFSAGEYYSAALEILTPKLDGIVFGNFSGNGKSFLKALDFAFHYRAIRDLLYISFAKQDAIYWSKKGRIIRAKINDPSIIRQLAHERQIFFLNSIDENTKSEKIGKAGKLLTKTSRWDLTNKNVNEALDIIEIEVDWKVKHLFNHLPEDCEIDIGGYSYSEFLKVYKGLLSTALYERYYSTANNLSCIISFNEFELEEATSKATSISTEKCSLILTDIAKTSRGSFNKIINNEYTLLPFCFSLKDGIGSILKLFAGRNSSGFSSKCAGIIGTSLVREVSSYFKKYRNFSVLTEVSLRDFNNELPDIDCLAISYEPSLGFHFFVCEVKNNLPSTWAKEYLKSIGKKGYLEKAIDQSKKILDFLNSPAGSKFLYEIAIKSFPNLNIKNIFPTGFCGLIDMIIITSQSAGIFYPEIKTTIICNAALRHIVENSDGDVVYIQHHLRSWSFSIDSTYNKKWLTVDAGHFSIRYEGGALKSLLQLSKNKYISDGMLEKIE